MLLKKLISSALALSMLVSCITLVKAEEAPKLSDKVEEAHTVLSNIGFVSSDFSKDMVAEMGDVTRGEFTELVHQSFAKGLTSDNTYFHDVPKTHYAAQAISVLVEKGAITVNDQKRFEPDRAITRTEAAKIILYVVGYESLVSMSGPYPSGVNTVANELKLYDGISQTETLSYGDALVMLYNGLLCEYMEVASSGANGPVYGNTGETYGERFFGIKVNKGLVTGFDGVSIYGEKVADDMLVVDRVEIKAEGQDLLDFLGHKVKYVVREIDDENFLLYINKDEKQNYIELNCIDNEFEYKNNSFEYYISDKAKTQKLEQNPTVIYNGAYLGSGITAALSEDLYSVKLIQSENSGYDVVIATSYEAVTLSAVDTQGEKLYVKTAGVDATYKTVDLKTYENVNIVDASGAVIEIENLAKDSILSIFETKDNSKIKIVVSNDSFSGRLETIYKVNDRECYKINGNEYYAYKKGIRAKYASGQDVIVYLDINGLVADMSSSTKNASFAFVKNIFEDDIGEGTILKAFDESGAFMTLLTAEKVNIDGENVDSALVYNKLGGFTFESQMIAYETNADGKVWHIDTAVKNSKDVVKSKNNMLVIEAEGSEQYDLHSNKLGKRMRVNSDTLLFGVPVAPKTADETLFGVASATAKLVNSDSYDYILYSYGEEAKEAADAIVVSGMYVSGTSLLSDNFVVTNIKTGLNSNDEVSTIVEGYHGANTKSYTFTQEASEELLAEVHPGDVLTLSRMVGNDVSKYFINLCPHEETQDGKYKRPVLNASGANSVYSFVTAQNASLQTWSPRYITGYVSDVVGESVMVKYDRINAATTPIDFDVSTAEDWDELFITQKEPVIVLDVNKSIPSKTRVEKGTIEDIKTYKVAGADCSRIFIYINQGDVRNFVIYN